MFDSCSFALRVKRLWLVEKTVFRSPFYLSLVVLFIHLGRQIYITYRTHSYLGAHIINNQSQRFWYYYTFFCARCFTFFFPLFSMFFPPIFFSHTLLRLNISDLPTFAFEHNVTVFCKPLETLGFLMLKHAANTKDIIQRQQHEGNKTNKPCSHTI